MNKKKILYIIFSLEIVIVGFLTYKILALKYGKSNEQSNAIAEVSVTPYPTSPGGVKDDSINFLLLGYGGAGHSGGYLSDVIMIVNVNPVKKTANFISIPRDLWVEIPVRSDLKKNFKVNAAYAIGMDDRTYGLKEPQYKGGSGAANLTKKVVGDATGLQIRNYIAIDFDSFRKLIDTLGGIEADVPVAFDDYHYPIKGRENETCGLSATQIAEFHQKYSGDELNYQFPCRYEHLHFDKGLQHIDGESSLKFVRSRHSAQDGGDFARSRRQKVVLLGVKDKLISLNGVKNAETLFDELKGLVKTDIDVKGIKVLSQLFGNPKDYKTNFIGLNEDNVLTASKSLDGQFILIPKEGENMWRGVQSFIYNQIK